MSLSPSSALVLAVVSGKGGAGKSTVAVNLAEALADAGHRVALLDADLGQGSCTTLFNETPGASVAAYACGAVPLDAVFHPTQRGVTLVAGGSAAPASLDDPLYAALDEVLGALAATHAIVLIDAPAGVGETVCWALDRADAGLLVLVGEPTSVTGAYALVKTICQTAPEYPFLAVVNAADTDADAAQTVERFADLTTRFLGAAPVSLGWVPYSAHVRAGVKAQTPALRLSPSLRLAFDGLAGGLAPLLPAPLLLRTAA